MVAAPMQIGANAAPTGFVSTKAGILVPADMLVKSLRAEQELNKARNRALREVARGAFFSDWTRLTGFNQAGAMEKPEDEVNFSFLRDTYEHSAIDQVIINTRIQQIRQVSQRCRDPKKHAGFRVVHKCLTPDTEVLTKERGWVGITDVSKKDFVATRSESGLFEWENPTALHNYDHSGNMIHMKSRNLDLMVTPNHRVLVAGKTISGWGKEKIIEAKDTVGISKRWAIPRTSEWIGIYPNSVVEKNGEYYWLVNGKIPVQLNVWVAFMGIFLAEGHTYGPKSSTYQVGISQMSYSEHWTVIHELLNKMPFKWVYRGHQFLTHNRYLWDELRVLGKSYTKLIPTELKNLPAHYLKTMWEWAVMGDGTRHQYETQGRDKVKETGIKIVNLLRNSNSPLTVQNIMDGTGFTYHSVRDCLYGLERKTVVEKTLARNECNKAYWKMRDTAPLQNDKGLSESVSLITVSKIMADDWQEVLQKIGLSASVRKSRSQDRTGDAIDGRVVKSRVDSYRVSLNKSTHQTFTASVIEYSGTVHCLTVPNGIFYVRRNGYPCWTGNSHDQEDFEESDELKQLCEHIEDIIANPWKQVHPNGVKDVFTTAVREELVVDRKVAVLQRDRRWRPNRYHMIDGATILPVLRVLFPWLMENAQKFGIVFSPDDPESLKQALSQAGEEISNLTGIPQDKLAYVQEIDAKIMAGWTADQLSIDITQPSVWTNKLPYGQGSLLQQSIELTAAWVNGWQYNQSLFRTNYPERLVAIKGDYDPNGLEAMKRKIFSEAGPASWERLLIMPGDEDFDVKTFNLRDTPKDMLYGELLRIIINLKTAVYRMDPSTIGFSHDSGAGASLFASGDREKQLAMAEEEGFHGLLQNLANWFTEMIVKPWHPDLIMIFDGLKQEQEQDRIEISSKAVGAYWTIDEARSMENKPPLPNGAGKLPLPLQELKMQGENQASASPFGGMQDEGKGNAPKPTPKPPTPSRKPQDEPVKKSLAKSLVIEVLES